MRTIDDVIAFVHDHRCFGHPIFEHWAQVNPGPEVVGSLFHQIRTFCDSTRPGGQMPDALRTHGLDRESHLLDEIVESEEDHGPELATMAGYILNKAAGRPVCPDLTDQLAVEAQLKAYSDQMLGGLPGYDHETGLTVQCRRARSVFSGRMSTDRETTIRNLGTALALEIISNRQLIPGEKTALVDSGLYGANLEDDEMHYLLEHWGELGAEQQHEKNAAEAVGSVLNAETEPLIMEGAREFLDSLASLWDVLDATLLHSGWPADTTDRYAEAALAE